MILQTLDCLPLLLLGVLLASVSPPPPQYQVVHGWPELPAGKLLGPVTVIGVNSRHEVFVFRGAENSVSSGTPTQPIAGPAVMVFAAASGKLITSWGDGKFTLPHGLTIDAEDNVWVTDVALHQVLKFDRSGKLLMTIGERDVPGLDERHFDKPTDVAIAADGSVYVGDVSSGMQVKKFVRQENARQEGSPCQR
jgi:peptidylamidoglycolate lyase